MRCDHIYGHILLNSQSPSAEYVGEISVLLLKAWYKRNTESEVSKMRQHMMTLQLSSGIKNHIFLALPDFCEGKLGMKCGAS